LEKYVARSTVKPDIWLVCNDGEPYTYNLGQEVLTRQAQPKELHSMLSNWLHAMPYLERATAIVCLEDDDWINEKFIETQVRLLEKTALAGQRPARYYNLRFKRYRTFRNGDLASMAQTAFRAEVLPLVARCCQRGSVFLDREVWRSWRGSKQLVATDNHVSLKGWHGIGEAHRKMICNQPDPNHDVLRKWLGADAGAYEEWFARKEFSTAPTEPVVSNQGKSPQM